MCLHNYNIQYKSIFIVIPSCLFKTHLVFNLFSFNLNPFLWVEEYFLSVLLKVMQWQMLSLFLIIDYSMYL